MAGYTDNTGPDYVANQNARNKRAAGEQGGSAGSSISSLPKSSNAGLGIDATVALGTAASKGRAGAAKDGGAKTSKEMNSGASVKNANNAENYGKGSERQGSVGARDNAGIFGTKGEPKGAKVVPATGGQMSKSSGAIYGAGANAKGTQGTKNIDRAKKGLNKGNKS